MSRRRRRSGRRTRRPGPAGCAGSPPPKSTTPQRLRFPFCGSMVMSPPGSPGGTPAPPRRDYAARHRDVHLRRQLVLSRRGSRPPRRRWRRRLRPRRTRIDEVRALPGADRVEGPRFTATTSRHADTAAQLGPVRRGKQTGSDHGDNGHRPGVAAARAVGAVRRQRGAEQDHAPRGDDNGPHLANRRRRRSCRPHR